MTPASPLSRLEKLAKEYAARPDQWPHGSCPEAAFLEGSKATLKILSEPGEACGPRDYDLSAEEYADLNPIPAVGQFREWNAIRTAHSDGMLFEFERREAELLQARAALEAAEMALVTMGVDYGAEIAHLKNRDQGLTAMNKHYVQQLTLCEKANASSEARVRILTEALEGLKRGLQVSISNPRNAFDAKANAIHLERIEQALSSEVQR